MYERFTDRARKVMQLANQEAQRFNHEFIGTEHILLALIKEGTGVGANVLKNVGINLRQMRLSVEKRITSGPEMITMGKCPQTEGAKKVIEHAIRAANALQHNYVGTEHLLCGLYDEAEGSAADVLRSCGLNCQKIVEGIEAILDQGQAESTDMGKLLEKASGQISEAYWRGRGFIDLLPIARSALVHLRDGVCIDAARVVGVAVNDEDSLPGVTVTWEPADASQESAHMFITHSRDAAMTLAKEFFAQINRGRGLDGIAGVLTEHENAVQEVARQRSDQFLKKFLGMQEARTHTGDGVAGVLGTQTMTTSVGGAFVFGSPRRTSAAARSAETPPEKAPLQCICSTADLMSGGCRCGAMDGKMQAT